MKYVAWEVIPGTYLPMMEDDNGELFGTNKTVCEGLGIKPSTLREFYRTNKEEFESLSVRNVDAKEFLKANKEDFNIKRVRDDMKIWSEDDMLTFAFLVKSDKGREFRRGLRTFLKKNAIRHYVSVEDHEKLKSDLNARLASLETLVLQTQRAAEYDASLAGKLLSNHRNTKAFRKTYIN